MVFGQQWVEMQKLSLQKDKPKQRENEVQREMGKHSIKEMHREQRLKDHLAKCGSNKRVSGKIVIAVVHGQALRASSMLSKESDLCF